MKYCTACLVPDTKPHATFNAHGVCTACEAHRLKNQRLTHIDWKARASEFDAAVQEAKAKNAPWYDALVPVSGGKDSISQVHRDAVDTAHVEFIRVGQSMSHTMSTGDLL